jgi:hypothetical protein
MAEDNATQLLGFFAQELQLFFQHMHEAVEKMSEEGGELPPSLFKARAIKSLGKRGKKGEGGAKRKPSVFNLFVKEKLEKLKATTAGAAAAHTTNFKDAVSAWSALTDEQKAQYAAKYAPIIAAAAEGGAGPSGAAPAAAPAHEDSEETSSEEEEAPPPPPPTSEKKKKVPALAGCLLWPLGRHRDACSATATVHLGPALTPPACMGPRRSIRRSTTTEPPRLADF